MKGFSLRGAARWDALVQLSGGDRQLPGNAYVQSTEADQRDARAALVLRHARPAPWRGLFSATVSARADGLDHESAAAAIRQRGQGGSLRLEASAPLGPASLDAGVSAGGERLEATGLADDARARAEGAAWAAVDVPALGGRLRLAPAVRAEVVGPFRGISAKLGASAAIVGPLSLRASAGRTFRPPSFSELHLTQGLLRPNPDLDPERGTSADVTLAAEGALGLAAVGAFASVYDDLVVYVPVFRAFRPENDDRALVRGIEAEAATVPLGPFRVQAQGALTLQETRTLRGRPEEVGNDVPRRPRARAFARVGAERGWVALHAELHHTGRQALDTRGIQWIDAATSVNAGGSVRLARRANVRAHLEVRNLGDDRTLEDGFGNPLPGRMVMVTLRADGATR